MTQIYFVRHAQPVHSWAEDSTRPLTPQGMADSARITEFFRTTPVDVALCSPYQRSVDTIRGAAQILGLSIRTDERFRERESGHGGNRIPNLFQKRWADFTFAEPGGESLDSVQRRNVAALAEVLAAHPEKRLLIGTHGTALSSILNHYDPSFGCEDFLRLINYTPYILRLDFEGARYIGRHEELVIEREYIE